MSDLSPELQRLVLAGRSAARPTDADGERVFTALQARLGLTAGLAGGAMATTVTETATRKLATKTLAMATAGLALVIGGIAVVTSLVRGTASDGRITVDHAAAGALSQPTAVAATAQPAPSLLDPAPATPQSEVKTTSASTSSHGASRAHDSLSEEVAILARAETELHAGRSAIALQLLNEHERRFKGGILAEERTAARIQALCALGRVADANTQLARLSPQSLHGEPARQACAPPKNAPRRSGNLPK